VLERAGRKALGMPPPASLGLAKEEEEEEVEEVAAPAEVVQGARARAIDSPCECEHNNPDSLDARLFPSVVLAVAPAVTMDEASSLSRGRQAHIDA